MISTVYRRPSPRCTRYLTECPDAHSRDVLRLLPTLLQARCSSSDAEGVSPDGVVFMAPLLLQRGDEEAVRAAVAGSRASVQALREGLSRREGVPGLQGEVEMLQAVMEVLQL